MCSVASTLRAGSEGHWFKSGLRNQKCLSFQQLLSSPQPSELIKSPDAALLNVVKAANVRLSLRDEDEYVGKWPATPEQCGDFIQAGSSH